MTHRRGIVRWATAFAWATGLVLVACASTFKPCSQGGDVSWYPPVKGDMRCQQREDQSGRVVNHGSFRQLNAKGRVILEGAFEEGRKNGVWVQYNERGEKIAERYFEKGVEKTVPRSDQGTDSRIAR